MKEVHEPTDTALCVLDIYLPRKLAWSMPDVARIKIFAQDIVKNLLHLCLEVLIILVAHEDLVYI